jgi:hypothetical protein
MAAQDIETLLLDALQDSVTRNGVRLGPGADIDIRAALSRAAAEIDSLPTAQQAQKIADVKVATDRLIDEMVRQGRLIGSAPGVIGEETLRLSLLKLCPLWPFC